MFRKLRQIKQELDLNRVKEFLNKGKYSVLSLVGDDNYPYWVPLNYLYLESKNAIYFHSAKKRTQNRFNP